MKVLRAAVVLGLATPLVVLACGSDDNNVVQRGVGGETEGGADPGGAGGSGGTTSLSGSNAGGVPSAAGAGGTGGSGGSGGSATAGASGETNGGAGGAESEPACGDSLVGGGLVCFNAPVPLSLGEGTPTDVAIGNWDAEDGLDVLVASNAGLAYFSNDSSGGFGQVQFVGTEGAVLGSGQLDSGDNLDLLLGLPNTGTSNIVFGNGAGAATTTPQSNFNSEGVLFDFYVANVVGSSASQDFVATFSNSVSLVQTTGTEGASFLGPIQSIYPTNPQDGVIAKLGSSQWLVYSANGLIQRQLMTYDAGSVTLGAVLDTTVGGAPTQLDVGDFDEDGFDDVVATLTDSGDVNVLFGDGVGTGNFAEVNATEQFLSLTIGTSADAKTQRDVKVGDFNGDGHADIAVSVQALDRVAIFSGDGAGGFSEPELVSTGATSGPTRLAVGDLNGDGVDDLAVVATTSYRVVLLLSNP